MLSAHLEGAAVLSNIPSIVWQGYPLWCILLSWPWSIAVGCFKTLQRRRRELTLFMWVWVLDLLLVSGACLTVYQMLSAIPEGCSFCLISGFLSALLWHWYLVVVSKNLSSGEKLSVSLFILVSFLNDHLTDSAPLVQKHKGLSMHVVYMSYTFILCYFTIA